MKGRGGMAAACTEHRFSVTRSGSRGKKDWEWNHAGSGDREECVRMGLKCRLFPRTLLVLPVY